MTKKIFAVSGMKCVHCKANVENAIQALDGVTSVEANIDEKNVAVDYDEAKLTPEQIKEAVEDAGRYELEI